ATSPLAATGVDAREGDRLVAVDGVEVDTDSDPRSLLVDRGGRPVQLTLKRGRRRPHTVTVTPLTDETALRYREWVEANRAAVAEATDGRAGYIHIPDMGPAGFAEFHRYLLSEVDKDGLVVDVRYNRGGNVSQLLLQRLMRRRLGWEVTRWRVPVPFPYDAPAGPMVCITNVLAGADVDIFSHTFKLAGLGPRIGTRTWGGAAGPASGSRAPWWPAPWRPGDSPPGGAVPWAPPTQPRAPPPTSRCTSRPRPAPPAAIARCSEPSARSPR